MMCIKKIIIGIIIWGLGFSFSNAEEVSSFRAKYLLNVLKKGEIQFSRKGELIYKKDKGYIEEILSKQDNKEKRRKTIVDFLQGLEWRFDYSALEVEKINYKTIPSQDGPHPAQAFFDVVDVFLPFVYNALKKESLQSEGSERIGEKEYLIFSGEIAKYQFLGKKCKIWVDKENNFVYKFIIYEDKEPFLSIEVIEAEINPEIEDKEFSLEIPPEFMEVDITGHVAQQYQILVELYKLYARNEKLKEVNQTLQEEIEELKERLEEAEKKGLLEKTALKREVYRTKNEPFILFVDREMNFVIMGGREGNLVVGKIFEVYRGNKLLGKLEITRVYQDIAVAEPITEGLIEIIREKDRLVKLE